MYFCLRIKKIHLFFLSSLKVSPAHGFPVGRCIVLVSAALSFAQALLYVHCLAIVLMIAIIEIIEIIMTIITSKIILAIAILQYQHLFVVFVIDNEDKSSVNITRLLWVDC